MLKSNLFGDFFRKKRVQTGLTLRQFCQKHGLDSGNLSKLERGILPPPKSREKLESYASFLNLEQGSDDWYEFFDLAAACAGQIPDDVMSDEDLVKKLPLVFRTMRGEPLPPEQLDELVKRIRSL
ncbi:helix-turn-helix transcriptional regulator [candidate division KSB1 bacterium]|nr:helix-turn-helix transcriptional regulator [candidate division KSB1 bacterium]